MLNTLILEML